MITAAQIKSFRLALEKERDELRLLSDTTVADRAPVTLDQQSVGRLSRMDAMQQQSMDIAREQRRQQRIKVIEAALSRIDADDYGYCFTCGEDISSDRLNADPAATRCQDCMKA